MAFQAVPDTAEIVVTYLQNESEMKTVMHAELPGGYLLADLVVLAAVVDAAVAASWLPIQSIEVAYTQTLVRGLAFENDQEAVNNVSAGIGAIAGSGLPSNVTYSIKKSSGLTGRSARGRLYWIGIAAAQLAPNENRLSQGQSDTFVAAVDAMRVAISVTVWQAVIVSRFTGGAQRATGVTFDWIDTVAADLNIDSQRRRLLG